MSIDWGSLLRIMDGDAFPANEKNPACPYPEKCDTGSGSACSFASLELGAPCRCVCHGEDGTMTPDQS